MACPDCDGRGEYEVERLVTNWPDEYSWHLDVDVVTVPCQECQQEAAPVFETEAA